MVHAMWKWFKKDPIKRIGAAVLAVIALYVVLKFLGFISGFLFKTIFVLAIALALYVGFKKLTGKFTEEEPLELPESTKVARKKASNRS